MCDAARILCFERHLRLIHDSNHACELTGRLPVLERDEPNDGVAANLREGALQGQEGVVSDLVRLSDVRFVQEVQDDKTLDEGKNTSHDDDPEHGLEEAETLPLVEADQGRHGCQDHHC